MKKKRVNEEILQGKRSMRVKQQFGVVIVGDEGGMI